MGDRCWKKLFAPFTPKVRNVIMLDVETDNTNAIGLYLSCGFEIKTTYDYYELKIS